MLLYADMLDCLTQGQIFYATTGVQPWDLNVTQGLMDDLALLTDDLVIYGRLNLVVGNASGTWDLTPGTGGGNRFSVFVSCRFGEEARNTTRLVKVARNSGAAHYLSFSFTTSSLYQPLAIAGLQDGCDLADYPSSFAAIKALVVNSDGSVSFAGTTSAPGLIAVNTEYFVEIEADPTADTVKVWINQALALSLSVTGWFAAGLSKIGVVCSLNAGKSLDFVARSVTVTYDHIYVLDYTDDGTAFHARPAKQLKSAALPIASVAGGLGVYGATDKKTALTAVSGVTFDLAQGAISTGAANESDAVALDASGVSGKTILGVIEAPIAMVSGLRNNHKMSIKVRDGAGTRAIEQPLVPFNFRAPIGQPLFEKASDGAAWTDASIAAATVGYEITETV